MKDKILSIVTLVTMLFSFTGCGDGGSSSTTTQTKQSTLTVDFKSAKNSFAQKANVNDISEVRITITKGSTIYLDNAPMVKNAVTKKWGIGINLDNSLAPYNVLIIAKDSGGNILYRTPVGTTLDDLTENLVVVVKEVVEEEPSSANLPSVKSITHSSSGNTVNIRFVINNAVNYELSSTTGGVFTTPTGIFSSTTEAVLDAIYTKANDEVDAMLKIKLINSDGDILEKSFIISGTTSENTITVNFPPVVQVNVEEQLIPINSYKITASVTDDDSTSWTYGWGKIRGAKALASDVAYPNVLEIEALINGEVYPLCFALTVTDDDGASSSLDYCIKNTDNGYVGLKKTGQTKSYAQDGTEMTDESVEDDGFYTKGLTPQYSRDDVAKIVMDHVAGLAWQDDENVNINTYTWLEAIDYCKGKGNGWRSPTIQELSFLSEYGNSNSINSIFQQASTNIYWSVSESVNSNNEGAWAIGFDGGVLSRNKTLDNDYIRCVNNEID